ncbi:MAG TPA: GNAT family N-acetyltransferase, partial [Thermomicrobiales bacterium]|nr:GNAT family N-acetyltransferase [Thermomicrobiales bacterium]
MAGEVAASRSNVTLRPCRGAEEYPHLVEVWRSAVIATHHFHEPEHVAFHEANMATDYLPGVEVTVAELDGTAVGFSGTTTGFLAMLFVDDTRHGQGIGSALLLNALARYPDLHLDVNEQNPQAVGFYLRHGFRVVGRSPVDDAGDPFPLLHLAYQPESTGNSGGHCMSMTYGSVTGVAKPVSRLVQGTMPL